MRLGSPKALRANVMPRLEDESRCGEQARHLAFLQIERKVLPDSSRLAYCIAGEKFRPVAEGMTVDPGA